MYAHAGSALRKPRPHIHFLSAEHMDCNAELASNISWTGGQTKAYGE